MPFDGTAMDANNKPPSGGSPSLARRHFTGDVVVDIDGNANSHSRPGSYDFWPEATFPSPPPAASPDEAFSFKRRPSDAAAVDVAGGGETDDPPARLIGSFLTRQSTAEMEELLRASARPAAVLASKEPRVSFKDLASSPSESESETASESHHSGEKNKGGGHDDAEVVRCTANSSHLRNASLLIRSKSRLADPLPVATGTGAADDTGKSSARPPRHSGQMRSGILAGKSGAMDGNEDDDDPFVDEEIPDELKRAKCDLWTVLQFLSLIAIVGALSCTLAIKKLAGIQVQNLQLWKWEVLVLVLICGRLLSGWIMRIAVFFVERNFVLRKRLLYFVYGVRSAAQNCLWLGLVLISWQYLFDRRVTEVNEVLKYVTKVLFCLLLATVARLIKTLLLKFMASSFHVSTYFDRIQEALFNQYVIETLSGPPVVDDDRMFAEVKQLQNAGAKMPDDLRATMLPPKTSGQIRPSGQVGKIRLSGPVIGKGSSSGQLGDAESKNAISIDKLHKWNQKNISAWNMKRLIRIVRYGLLTTIDEQAQLADQSTNPIQSEQEAKVAAKSIFKNVAKPGSKYIYLSDLMRFMREEEAVKAMNLFEGAKQHDRISRKSLKNWVVNAFRERKALALTLNDTKTAVDKLHQMANIVVGIIVFALWLLILDIANKQFFILLSSQLVLAVFMFGNTLKTVFEAIVFLFVMHPFDVGDRCEVDGVQYVVEEMNILTTVFLRYDNLKVYYPNTILATKPIMNYYRSPDMGDSIDFCVHVATPVEKLAIMKEKITKFIDSRKEHWYPDSQVVLRDVDDMNKLKVSIWMQQRINFQDMGERFKRREQVLEEMVRVLRELDIEYRMLPLDVNIRETPSIASTRMPSTWSTFN